MTTRHDLTALNEHLVAKAAHEGETAASYWQNYKSRTGGWWDCECGLCLECRDYHVLEAFEDRSADAIHFACMALAERDALAVAETPPPPAPEGAQPDSADWWRGVAQGLSAEIHKMRTAAERVASEIAGVVSHYEKRVVCPLTADERGMVARLKLWATTLAPPAAAPPQGSETVVERNHAQDLRDAGLLLAPEHAAPPLAARPAVEGEMPELQKGDVLLWADGATWKIDVPRVPEKGSRFLRGVVAIYRTPFWRREGK